MTGAALAEIQKTTDTSHLIKDKKNTSPIVKTTVNELKIDCFAYDVAKDPITIHIPVVRLFVGKFHIHFPINLCFIFSYHLALHVHLQKYTDTITTFNNLVNYLLIFKIRIFCFLV